MHPEIILTADGSHTLYVPELNEHYHSIHGAIQESRHVFIQEGFYHCNKNSLNILEIGFGTGLNVLLTYFESKKTGKRIYFQTIDNYPLKSSIIKELNYPEILQTPTGGRIFRKLHNSPWGKKVNLSYTFTLFKIQADIKHHLITGMFDIIYYDAFGPDKQPEMWTPEIFKKIYKTMNTNAIFVTYTAKGKVRRTLQETGLDVSLVPGPPGKRHMLRGVKIKGKRKYRISNTEQ
ncbi:MAG: tRNA (5-methylaminomethyl-2-thiouridine)(34)-methyltransferase MnmD [Bacteroidales bacterium]|nr:tRNA (5-methylaminomethyl-2-thiouridine)(34)-methyltransferase MnmD [Bacteroidales bacterium]